MYCLQLRAASHGAFWRKTLGRAQSSDVWRHFHKKTISERRNIIGLGAEIGLRADTADNMIENAIGTFSLPMGVLPRIQINEKSYTVPMVVEEPSVIAAASALAKVTNSAGGFRTHHTAPIMTTQVELRNVKDFEKAKGCLRENEESILALANTFCPGMLARGGGVCGMDLRHLSTPVGDSLMVHLHCNVMESMGANVLNSIAEGVSDHLAATADATVGLQILSNLSPLRRTSSECRIPVEALQRGEMTGFEVAQSMVHATEIAKADPFRACTHNKGVMNGISAVALATGQDTRAIEAAAHTYASVNSGSMTDFFIEASTDRV